MTEQNNPYVFNPKQEVRESKRPTYEQWVQAGQEFVKRLNQPSWEEFRKFRNYRPGANPDDFYGCVDAEGVWFDSSEAFDVAVHWCCAYIGQFNLSNEEEIQWMDTEGRKLGYSIIHGSQIKRMYEAGLIS